ncbi:MAG: DUF2185 domain-containing protein [Bacteroidota bacterium]
MKEFEDTLNTAVITTKFVVKDKKEITYVTHDADDGAWQFFSSDDFDNYEDVAMILSLEEIINIDRTVLEIANLPLGYFATRKTSKDRWTINKPEIPKRND